MSDLISRSALLARYDRIHVGAPGAARKMIEEAPTIDAVPVVHGRWEEWWPGMSVIMTGEEMLYRCSSCDAKYPDVEGYRYCPNCGAKMDGGTDETD